MNRLVVLVMVLLLAVPFSGDVRRGGKTDRAGDRQAQAAGLSSFASANEMWGEFVV